MGLVKDFATSLAKETAKDVAVLTASDAIVGGIKKHRSGDSVTSRVSDTFSGIRDNRNMAELKKQAKKQDYCLFVTKEQKIGNGVYNVITKKKEDKYNTLISEDARTGEILHLYSSKKGELAAIQKVSVTTKKGLLSSKSEIKFLIYRDNSQLGSLMEAHEGTQKVYTTDFNDWFATGEFHKGNYKIFARTSGKTLASVSKKYGNASTYSIECEYDKNEPLIVLLTIFIDLNN